MGRYDATDNRWLDADPVEFAASAERTATGQGASVDVRDHAVVRLTLDVTAVGVDANETLDVAVETSEDGVTWYTAGSFAQVTQPGGATSQRKTFAVDRYVRVAWTVAGTTPQFTFSVDGEAA